MAKIEGSNHVLQLKWAGEGQTDTKGCAFQGGCSGRLGGDLRHFAKHHDVVPSSQSPTPLPPGDATFLFREILYVSPRRLPPLSLTLGAEFRPPEPSVTAILARTSSRQQEVPV
ncbi:hypothetical protein BaRGS_00010159 [Batillaria attramentaria]|uniref:Uncharacterized protein n=1 Tax=Batillaria attramentaria TaxID=370345 RepID=A0ABD0LG97_9CAEN